DQLRRRDNRIDRLMRTRRMAGSRMNGDVELVRRAVGHALHEGEGAGWFFRLVMKTERIVNTVQNTVSNHGAGAAFQRFFGWLEHQLHIATETRRDFLEYAAYADQRRRMEIMT